MFSPDDTIVAIATPPGRGALGIVRVSGPEAHAIGSKLLGRTRPFPPRRAIAATMDLGDVGDSSSAGDQVVAIYFQRPRSFTGDDALEITAHGSPAVLSSIVREAVRFGARLAGPGEFTLRAFLNGRIDLVQAEAVGDLVDAVTPRQARVAFDQLRGTLSEAIASVEGALFDVVTKLEASLDFPEEGYHFVDPQTAHVQLTEVVSEIERLLASAQAGRVIREGRVVAIVGRPNVGKSSLFNALLGVERAIVTPIAGTTRDLLSERVEMSGIPVTVVDSAGLQLTVDPVEEEGVIRARRLAGDADARLVVLDCSRELEATDRELISSAGPESVVVINKIDERPVWTDVETAARVARVSARTGSGLDELRRAIVHTLARNSAEGGEAVVTNVRHESLLIRARTALVRAREGVGASVPEEFVLQDVRDALDALAEVTGERTADDVLAAIFSRFCIGK